MRERSELLEKLVFPEQQQFTGIVAVDVAYKKHYQIYYLLGKLVWIQSDFHLYRSWRRNLVRYCSQAAIEQIPFGQIKLESRQYDLITCLHEYQLIKREQLKILVQERIKELLFDLVQQEYKHSFNFTCEPKSSHTLLKEGFIMALASDRFEETLTETQQEWSKWLGKGLASCSPNLAPCLKNTEDLSQAIPDLVYRNMARLLNGKNTLRDLAVMMNQDVFELTCALMPYFFKGYLRLLEISDLPDLNLERADSQFNTVPHIPHFFL
jgi:hypothetical protein